MPSLTREWGRIIPGQLAPMSRDLPCDRMAACICDQRIRPITYSKLISRRYALGISDHQRYLLLDAFDDRVGGCFWRDKDRHDLRLECLCSLGKSSIYRSREEVGSRFSRGACADDVGAILLRDAIVEQRLPYQ